MTEFMPQGLLPSTKDGLQRLADEAGVSVEAFIRQHLDETFGDDPDISAKPIPKFQNIVEAAQYFFRPENGVDLQLPPRGRVRPAPTFD